MDINEIKEILPHRYPFLLIDKVISMEGNKIVAIKNVTVNENYFQGHFPAEAVMPGVLIIEALAQTGAVAILSKNEFKGKPLFIRHQTNGNKKDMYVMFKNTFIDMVQKKLKNFELLEVILGCPDIHITDKIVEVNTKYFRNYLTMIYELKD